MTARVVRLRKAAERDPTWSDEAVAHACLSGDPAAVAELFDRFHARVTRYLTRALGQSADVEDLLQATFMEVARGGCRFEGRSTVSTWLLGIATNVVRHHIRASSRRRGMLDAVASASSGSFEPSAADVVDARLALQRAHEVLAALPVEQRMAFVLCELEGLKAGDAARLLEATESAVWKRVSDVRRAIRDAIGRGDRT